MEPQARYETSGPVAGVGASLAWAGDKVGSGSQRIIESVPGQKVVNALDFDGSKAVGTFVLAPTANGTRVTWSLDSAHGYNPVSRWFGLMLDRWVGADYDKGLKKLKSVLESETR
ncbi:SRPBCC family protein [Lysobacter koreensis]|uniref:SRPBCC family protein n=1 Tax=Lysobacter koreensis TaxID=266122 RepID=A0ABW2YP58_9GAMM